MESLSFALITGGSGMIGSNIDFGYKPSSTEMNICDKCSIENYINSKSNISCAIYSELYNTQEKYFYLFETLDKLSTS